MGIEEKSGNDVSERDEDELTLEHDGEESSLDDDETRNDADSDDQQSGDDDQGSDDDDDAAAASADDESGSDDEVTVTHADDSSAAEEGKEKPKGPPRRVRKLLEKNDRLSEEKGELQQKLTGKDAENELLRMRIKQLQGKDQPEKPVMPTLESCGYDEQKYAQAMENWVRNDVAPSVLSEQLSRLDQDRQQEQVEEQRKEALESHYQRADQLKVKDYDDTEDKVVAIMGRELVQEIAATVDESANLLYYLGKNPSKAEEFKRKFDENPAAATYALGKFAGGLSIKPVSKKPTPKPDKPLDGKGPSGNVWDKRLEKARAEAQKTGSMDAVLKVKREAAKAGVNL